MGVPWGIESATTDYMSRDKIVGAWTAFAEADLCRRFVIPIDDTFHTFQRAGDGTVNVTWGRDIDLLDAIRALHCGDGTYDEFEMLFDGYSLLLPDMGGERIIPRGTLPWGYDRAHSLALVRSLPGGRLAKELATAGKLAEERGLIISISF